jgi:hypothetical protein
MVLKVEGYIYPVLEFRDEKQTFAIVVESKMVFFLNSILQNGRPKPCFLAQLGN